MISGAATAKSPFQPRSAILTRIMLYAADGRWGAPASLSCSNQKHSNVAAVLSSWERAANLMMTLHSIGSQRCIPRLGIACTSHCNFITNRTSWFYARYVLFKVEAEAAYNFTFNSLAWNFCNSAYIQITRVKFIYCLIICLPLMLLQDSRWMWWTRWRGQFLESQHINT